MLSYLEKYKDKSLNILVLSATRLCSDVVTAGINDLHDLIISKNLKDGLTRRTITKDFVKIKDMEDIRLAYNKVNKRIIIINEQDDIYYLRENYFHLKWSSTYYFVIAYEATDEDVNELKELSANIFKTRLEIGEKHLRCFYAGKSIFDEGESMEASRFNSFIEEVICLMIDK